MAIGECHQHSRLQELLRQGCPDPEAVHKGRCSGMVQVVEAQAGEFPGQLLLQQSFLVRGEVAVGKCKLVQRSEPKPPSRRREPEWLLRLCPIGAIGVRVE